MEIRSSMTGQYCSRRRPAEQLRSILIPIAHRLERLVLRRQCQGRRCYPSTTVPGPVPRSLIFDSARVSVLAEKPKVLAAAAAAEEDHEEVIQVAALADAA